MHVSNTYPEHLKLMNLKETKYLLQNLKAIWTDWCIPGPRTRMSSVRPKRMVCCWTGKPEQFWTSDTARLVYVLTALVLTEPSAPTLGAEGGARLQRQRSGRRCWDTGHLRSIPRPPPVCAARERRNSFNEAISKIQQVWSRTCQELPLFKRRGYFSGTGLYSIIHAAPPRTRFLFLEEPPFADCREGNTQEELLAVTCFSKHWM